MEDRPTCDHLGCTQDVQWVQLKGVSTMLCWRCDAHKPKADPKQLISVLSWNKRFIPPD